MSHRDTNRKQLILTTIFEQKRDRWNEETRKVAQSDAQRILEAMIAEFGIEGAVSALDNQGFKGKAYHYLIAPLCEEAYRRRVEKPR